MILAEPNNLEDFIGVSSQDAIKLSFKGFVPIYRSLKTDTIYFSKNEDIEKVVRLWNLQTK